MKADQKRALGALQYIIPILKNLKLKWLITTGFACYVYGVKRPITDIDIDINTTIKSAKLKKLLKIVKPQISQKLEHYIDQNYDNYNFELNIKGQILDICTMKELKVYNQKFKKYKKFYGAKFPPVEIVEFQGLKLPILSKKMLIKNKEMLVWQRPKDLKDIEGLRKLLKK